MDLKMYGITAKIGSEFTSDDRIAIPDVENHVGEQVFLKVCGQGVGWWTIGFGGENLSPNLKRVQALLAIYEPEAPIGLSTVLLPDCLSDVKMFEVDVTFLPTETHDG